MKVNAQSTSLFRALNPVPFKYKIADFQLMGKVKKLIEYNGSGTISAEYEFNTDGMLKKITEYSPSGVTDFVYNLKKGEISVIKNSASFKGTYTYKLNEAGYIIRRVGGFGGDETYSYNNSMQLVSTKNNTYGTTNYEYNADGQLIRQTYYAGNGELQGTYTYSYRQDDRKNTIVVYQSNEEGEIMNNLIYYNDKNSLIRESSYSADKSYSNKTIYTSDVYGNWTTKSSVSESKQPNGGIKKEAPFVIKRELFYY